MSLADLTRNAFQSGISPVKWVKLCKLYVSKHLSGDRPEDVGAAISNSVLVMFRAYPADPTLQEYLKTAIRDGLLPLHVFVTSFLQAARSPELHNGSTLDALCRVVLECHYSTGMPPVGSVVPYAESAINILGTIQDALALLRTAHTLPISSSHRLPASASELVILLISSVTDITQVSTAQAMVHFADANDMLQSFRLSPDVRHVLENFVLSLSLVIGDDAKAAREAQMLHAFQLELSKDILGPSSETDIVTCSLMLHHFLFHRARQFGSGDGPRAVAILVRTLRATSWTPPVFYTQLFQAAVTCLSQSMTVGPDSRSASLWRAFIIARLPRLLVLFEAAVESDGTIETDWRSAMQIALHSLFQRMDILSQCEHPNFHMGALESANEETDASRSFSRDFLWQLATLGLVEQSVATQIDSSFTIESPSRLLAEIQDTGLDVETFLETKLSSDASQDDTVTFLERVRQDPLIHAAFGEVVLKRFRSLTFTLELEGLSPLARMLYLHHESLDLISLHVPISELVLHALTFLEDYDCETVGDPQTAVSLLGDVVLFLQATLARFHINPNTLSAKDRVLQLDYLQSSATVYQAHQLKHEDATAFTAWFKALFDSSSEGIADTIFRSTPPKTLLRLAPTLFSHAISSYLDQKIDKDVLFNGVSYFVGPLLNWTLVGVIKALVMEIQHRGPSVHIHLEVLQTLLVSSTCPKPVLSLCGASILRLLGDTKNKHLHQNGVFDAPTIRKLALQALSIPNENGQASLSLGPQIAWMDQPRQAIRDALSMARSGKAPALDVDRCLLVTTPSKFLHLFWSELSTATSLGAMEVCRRLATFALAMPRLSGTPPLLPIFLHVVLPSLISSIDHQPASEQSVNIELLVSIISSSLTSALHLEVALHKVCGEQRPVLGQLSSGMARRLASDLRRKGSPTAGVIAHRLSSSASFVANFPTFIAELQQ
ncbi:hypothetical protein JAAARDRAFT_189219 [Jaapia argillacea MUCL 33604]|uniref:Mediator of RNA polymerase II transcription subunit 5 n=1 Tax=Jaapia argillacea MUCL 33604 TaxID=933084 RepID=A0A067QBX1_9AGAM|nr:hypothetical protein JAAARDRAFT_189219 [Jaapia argillacea MUCL 33604]